MHDHAIHSAAARGEGLSRYALCKFCFFLFAFLLAYPPPTHQEGNLTTNHAHTGSVRAGLLGRAGRRRVRHAPLRDADPAGAGLVEARVDGRGRAERRRLQPGRRHRGQLRRGVPAPGRDARAARARRPHPARQLRPRQPPRLRLRPRPRAPARLPHPVAHAEAHRRGRLQEAEAVVVIRGDPGGRRRRIAAGHRDAGDRRPRRGG